MAECTSCNTPIKDGDWTCGACGAPVAGGGLQAPATAQGAAGHGEPAYGDSPGYGGSPPYGGPGQWGPEHQPRAATPSSARPAVGRDGLISLVVVGGLVAVVAVILVWFFVLRGPATTGEEFLGSWTAATDRGTATLVITRDGEAFSVLIAGNGPSQTSTVPAHLDGSDLVITMDDFSQMAEEDGAKVFKATLQAVAGDFTLILSRAGDAGLDLRIVGTSPDGEDYEETITLTRDAAETV
ncbi:MAG: hypothetical protein GX624_11225 [Actinobacteria bacterium]|nr:hypothetical protein [Actinomycetota bacterium]